MNNSDMSITPVLDKSRMCGLTKREAFAMAAMQGICASSPSVSNEIIAIEAVNLADNLLKQLENNQ